MKRYLLIFCILVVALSSFFLLFIRYGVAASEEYPSWEAVRNMLDRDGEIVIIVPKGATIISAQCNNPSAKVSIDRQVVTTKIGYSWSVISVQLEIAEKLQTLYFNPQKLNDWNRIRYEPVDSNDPYSDFIKLENGIEKPHHVSREVP